MCWKDDLDAADGAAKRHHGHAGGGQAAEPGGLACYHRHGRSGTCHVRADGVGISIALYRSCAVSRARNGRNSKLPLFNHEY